MTILQTMINLNSKGYDPNEMLSGTALDTVISALEGLSNVGSTLSGLAGISKSEIKNAIGIDHTVKGSNENDLLTGCSHGGDTLIGGDGNDTLNHAGGQEEDSRSDSLYGGNGFDTYFAGDWDYVNDSDGRGKVYFDGMSLNCTATFNEKTGLYESGSYTFFLIGDNRLQVHNKLTDRVLVIEAPNLADSKNKKIIYESLGIKLFKKDEEPEEPEEPTGPTDPDFGHGGGSGGDNPDENPDDGGEGDDANSADGIASYDNGSDIDRGFTAPAGADNPSKWDPLVLDLNHNGVIDTVDINAGGAYFDIDGTDGGIKERMGWIDDGDGFLVYDMNGNGKIDDITEMFGNATTNAFDDLKARADSNGDGMIDAKDDLFEDLRVWTDSNGNGKTDDGELHSLSSLGITSIGTNKTPAGTDNNGNVLDSVSSFTQNGENHIAGAVHFTVNQTTTVSSGQIYIKDLLLPILRGYGDVKDSILAMRDNDELRALVKDMASGDDSYVKTNFEKFMALWTGLDKKYLEKGLTKDFSSGLTKADKLWILEKLTGNYAYSAYIEQHNFADLNTVYNGSWQSDLSSWDADSFRSTITNYYGAFIFQKQRFSGAYYSAAADKIVIYDEAVFRKELTDFFIKKSSSLEGGLEAVKMMETFALTSENLDPAIIAGSGNVNPFMSFILNGHLDSLITLIGSDNLSRLAELPTALIGSLVLDFERDGTVPDNLMFGDETNNTINGIDNQTNIITGGRGNDQLIGGRGNDTYVFNRGDGKDTIDDQGGETDRIVFGEGITLSDLAVMSSGYDLHIALREEGKAFDQLTDKIMIRYYTDGSTSFYRGRIEKFEFADGTVVGIEEIISRAGTDGNDNLSWAYSPLNVDMGDGVDTISAGDFDDVIAGGRGDDRLYGGRGNDIYMFNRGDGADTVNDTAGELDRIVFNDVNADEFGFCMNGSALRVSYGDGADTINVSGNSIERFEFADGSYLTADDVNYLIQQMSAFSSDTGVSFNAPEDVRMNEEFNRLVTARLNRDF